MRFSVVAFLVLATLVNIVLGGERGFLSGFLNQKPVFIKVDLPFRPEAEASDKCSRQYPLIPRIRQQVPYGFRRYGVVPDLMQDPPANLLEVEYTNIKHCQPHLGNNIDVCDVIEAPLHLKWKCSPDKLYTIFVIDINPLGTTRPTLLANGILWWVVDVPDCNVTAGKTLFEYQAPLPLYGAGESRYVILAYEQPQYDIDWHEEPMIPEVSLHHRFNRCLDKLVSKYELKLIAGNFFVSEFKPCIESVLDGLDIPYPQYVDKAIEAAKLFEDPFATVAKFEQHYEEEQRLGGQSV